MAKQVENRVVEMEFKNKDFEKAVSVTMESLEELNKKLDQLNDVNISGFENVADKLNNTNFDKLSDNIDYIKERFSFLGEAVHDIWGDIVNEAEQAAMKMAGVITKPLDIINEKGKTRATNLAQAKFQLTNLGIEWDQIKQDIDYAVDDTRFGLDEAAMAASQLVASGVELGDEMKQALLGISGVAAMTNSEYSDIAHIFTTIAGTGKVYTQQLNMIAARGLNATAALAKEMETTEAGVREILSKKDQFIDFTTFARAMFNEYGKSAKKGNDLFSGALANAKAALGRIGEKFYTPFYEYARQVLVAVKPVINHINNALTPMFDMADDVMNTIKEFVLSILDTVDAALTSEAAYDHLANALLNILGGVWDILVAIGTSFSDIFGGFDANDIIHIMDRFDQFTESIRLSDQQLENLRRTLDGVWAAFDIAYKTLDAVFRVFIKPLIPGLAEVDDSILGVTGGIGDMLAAFDEVYDPFGPLYNAWAAITRAFFPITRAIKDFVHTVGEEFSKMTGITDMESFFAKMEEVITKLHLEDIFTLIGGAILYCIQQLGVFIDMLETNTSLKEYLKNLADQSKALTWIKEKFAALKQTISDLYNRKITLSQALGLDKLAEKFAWLNPIIEKFKEHYKSIFDAKLNNTEGLPFITEFGDKLKEAILNLKWEDIFGAIGAGFYAYWVKKSLEIKNKIAESFSGFVDVFKTFTEGINLSLVKMTKETNAEKILKIAAAVALLAGSIFILAQVDSGDVMKATGAIALLMVILIAFIAILGKLTESTKVLTDKSTSIMDPGGSKTTKTKGKGKNAITTIVENLSATLTEANVTIKEKIKNFGELPMLILSLAATVGMIALAIGKLANVANADRDSFKDAVIVTFLILIAITAITAALMTLANGSMMVNAGTLGAVSKLFLAIAVTLNLMIVPLAAITGLLAATHHGEVFVAFGVIMGLVALFGAVAVAFGYFINVANAGAVVAGAAAMALMGVAISLLTIPLVAIASIAKLGTLDDAFWTISGLIFELGALALLLGILGMNVVGSIGMLAGATSMILMAAAINALILPIAAITALVAATKGNTFDTAIKTVEKLIILMGIFSILFGLLTGVLGAATGGIAGGIAIAGMIAGAAAMIMMAKALQILLIPLAGIMALQKAGNIGDAFKDIAIGLTILGVATAAAILLAPGLFIIEGALYALGITAALIGTGIKGAGEGILFFVSALALLQAIDFENLSVKIAEAIASIIDGVTTALTAGRPQVSEGFLALLGAGLEALVGATGMIAEALVVLLKDVFIALDSHAQELGFHLGHALSDIFFYAIAGVASSMADIVWQALGGEKHFTKDFIDAFFPEKETKTSLKDTLMGIFTGGTKEAKDDINKENKEQGKENGESYIEGVAEGAEESKDELTDSYNSVLQNASTSIDFSSLKSTLFSGGQDSSNSLIKGTEDPLDIVGNKSIAGRDLGELFAGSYVNEIEGWTARSEQAGFNLSSSAKKGAADGQDSHSPSKDAIELANFFGAPYVEVVASYGKKAYDAGYGMSNSLTEGVEKGQEGSLNTIKASIGNLADLVTSEDMNLNPTITPVLDMTNVQTGFASLDSMFNRERSVALAGEVGSLNSANRQLNFEIQNDKSDMNGGFGTLGAKLDKFAEAMMSRQVVLDSGELVGGLVNPMDRSLGVRAIRAQRSGRR